MKHLLTLITVAVFFCYDSAVSSELLDANKLLESKGDFCISDGSSIYIFSPDGKFKSSPIGLSGRTIEGTWKSGSTKIYIKGKWGWVNGFSSDNDFREMDIHIGSVSDKTSLIGSRGKVYKVHEAYFYIERLEKKK